MVAPVQISTLSNWGGTSLSATTTLTGVTAGNHIILLAMHGDLGGNGPTLSASDAQGSYAIDVDSNLGLGLARVTMFRLANANAGTHAITCTASTGTTANSVGTTIAIEVPPVTLDQSNIAGGNGTAVSVSPTSSLAAVNELAVAGIFANNLLTGGGTFPPTGGTGTYISLVHAHDGDGDYQILTSTAGVGANWGTLSFSGKWAAVIGAYNAIATAPPPPLAPMSLGGMNVQVCQ